MWLEQINVVILLLVSIFSNFAYETTKKYFSKNISKGNGSIFAFTSISCFISAIVVFVAFGFDCKISTFTLILALAYGAVMGGWWITSTLAVTMGPWAYTYVLMSLAMVIPTFSGAIFWNEKLSLIQIIGVIFVIACILLSVQYGGGEDCENKKFNNKWLIVTLLSAFLSGMYGVIQKIHQSNQTHKDELSMFLVVSMLFAMVFALVATLFYKKRAGNQETLFNNNGKHKNFYILLLVLFIAVGVSSSFMEVINSYLSGAMDSAVLFPVFNGGSLMLVTIASIILYKEKLSLQQWIGMGCGAVAIFCLCL